MGHQSRYFHLHMNVLKFYCCGFTVKLYIFSSNAVAIMWRWLRRSRGELVSWFPAVDQVYCSSPTPGLRSPQYTPHYNIEVHLTLFFIPCIKMRLKPPRFCLTVAQTFQPKGLWDKTILHSHVLVRHASDVWHCLTILYNNLRRQLLVPSPRRNCLHISDLKNMLKHL